MLMARSQINIHLLLLHWIVQKVGLFAIRYRNCVLLVISLLSDSECLVTRDLCSAPSKWSMRHLWQSVVATIGLRPLRLLHRWTAVHQRDFSLVTTCLFTKIFFGSSCSSNSTGPIRATPRVNWTNLPPIIFRTHGWCDTVPNSSLGHPHVADVAGPQWHSVSSPVTRTFTRARRWTRPPTSHRVNEFCQRQQLTYCRQPSWVCSYTRPPATISFFGRTST